MLDHLTQFLKLLSSYRSLKNGIHGEWYSLVLCVTHISAFHFLDIWNQELFGTV